MIRIYLEEEFSVGKIIRIPKDELHYMKRVRRGQGDIEAFNQKGQLALGDLEGADFLISSVSINSLQSYPVTVAMAAPERDALSISIRSLSEIGIEKLILFSGDRSQSPRHIERSFEKLQKIALESMRQCARAHSLQLEWVPRLDDLKKKNADLFLFMDESSDVDSAEMAGDLSQGKPGTSALVIVGPEGGWSTRERDFAISQKWTRLHFNLPILKVATAAIVSSFYAVTTVSKIF